MDPLYLIFMSIIIPILLMFGFFFPDGRKNWVYDGTVTFWVLFIVVFVMFFVLYLYIMGFFSLLTPIGLISWLAIVAFVAFLLLGLRYPNGLG
ncbi:MAG: hypothetical protein AB1779_08970 [Candidatus Thermoplasmatota archaeon]